jgi:hypothetical protein
MAHLDPGNTLNTFHRLAYVSLLLAYLSFLAGLMYLHSISEISWSLALWQGDHSNPAVRHVWPIAAACLRDVVLFVPLGFLVSCGLGACGDKRGCFRLLLVLLSGMAIAWLLAMVLRTGWNGMPIRRPSLPAVAFLTFVTFVGCWAGATWFYARGAISWILGQLILIGVCLAGISGVVYGVALESEAMVFEAEGIETEDRRRLVKLFGVHDPRHLNEGSTDELTLSQRDVNQLLSWGLALGPDGQKARVEIEEEGVQLSLSSRIPVVERYLNVAAAGMAFVNDGELAVKPKSLRIGRLTIPRWMLVASGPSIINHVFQNRHTRPFLSSLKNVQLSSGSATVTYGPLNLTKDLLSDALVVLGGDDMGPATAAHVEHLIEFAESAESVQFGDCLRTAFDWAQKRVGTGKDPVHESRSAILALGYLLGHERVQSLVGPGLPDPSSEVHAKFLAVSLRRRNDWVRHFTLSAALEVLSNPATSNMLGLLKEELDADGGSGFSFADLLADNAGTVLAQQATSSDATARQIQERLAVAVDVDDYFPVADDLPEGLSDAEFREQYGGVRGKEYQELHDEIQRRILACKLYRAEP